MKRTTWFIIGGILLVALLASGAFMGARLLAQRSQTAGTGGDLALAIAGSSGPQRVSIRKQPAPELPQTPTDAQGIFVRREDSSIFVGTGQTQIMMRAAPGGSSPESGSSYDGPVVEVVTNQDTTIYRDTTEMPSPGSSGEVQVQQTVGPGSIDEIGQNSMIQVWGKKTGDRVVAQVLVYSQPTILNRAPVGK